MLQVSEASKLHATTISLISVLGPGARIARVLTLLSRRTLALLYDHPFIIYWEETLKKREATRRKRRDILTPEGSEAAVQ
jgi:hypothetical protein